MLLRALSTARPPEGSTETCWMNPREAHDSGRMGLRSRGVRAPPVHGADHTVQGACMASDAEKLPSACATYTRVESTPRTMTWPSTAQPFGRDCALTPSQGEHAIKKRTLRTLAMLVELPTLRCTNPPQTAAPRRPCRTPAPSGIVCCHTVWPPHKWTIGGSSTP